MPLEQLDWLGSRGAGRRAETPWQSWGHLGPLAALPSHCPLRSSCSTLSRAVLKPWTQVQIHLLPGLVRQTVGLFWDP